LGYVVGMAIGLSFDFSPPNPIPRRVAIYSPSRAADGPLWVIDQVAWFIKMGALLAFLVVALVWGYRLIRTVMPLPSTPPERHGSRWRLRYTWVVAVLLGLFHHLSLFINLPDDWVVTAGYDWFQVDGFHHLSSYFLASRLQWMIVLVLGFTAFTAFGLLIGAAVHVVASLKRRAHSTP
jgi:hypothetical protein